MVCHHLISALVHVQSETGNGLDYISLCYLSRTDCILHSCTVCYVKSWHCVRGFLCVYECVYVCMSWHVLRVHRLQSFSSTRMRHCFQALCVFLKESSRGPLEFVFFLPVCHVHFPKLLVSHLMFRTHSRGHFALSLSHRHPRIFNISQGLNYSVICYNSFRSPSIISMILAVNVVSHVRISQRCVRSETERNKLVHVCQHSNDASGSCLCF